nr:ATP-binding protein [Pseudomonas aeruginosa]
MADQIAEELAASGRPLIIDEMDHLVAAGQVELIRDLYESSQASILLIGEEMLPTKLKKYERFHGRVLSWVPPSQCPWRTPATWRRSTAPEWLSLTICSRTW